MDELKVQKVLSYGGTGDPDFDKCLTMAHVVGAVNDAFLWVDATVQPFFVQTEKGWYRGEVRLALEPVASEEVPPESRFQKVWVDGKRVGPQVSCIWGDAGKAVIYEGIPDLAKDLAASGIEEVGVTEVIGFHKAWFGPRGHQLQLRWVHGNEPFGGGDVRLLNNYIKQESRP